MRCSEDEDKVLAACEEVHGEGQCHRLNKFAYNKLCPIGYVQDDYTRCKRECDRNVVKNVIDFKCFNQKIEYINLFNSYKTMEECLEQFDHCREKIMSKSDPKSKIYLKDCSPNRVKIGFMFIPLCMSEMDDEQIKILAEDPNYCVEDYVNLGLPFYDFY